jgi:hypothetical protein
MDEPPTAEPGVPDGDCVGGGSSTSEGMLRDDLSGSASPSQHPRVDESCLETEDLLLP